MITELFIIDSFVVRLPVIGRIAEVLASLRQWSSSNSSSLLSFVLCSSGVGKELWLVIQLILDYRTIQIRSVNFDLPRVLASLQGT